MPQTCWGSNARRLIEDATNELLISPVVPWEIAIKSNKGKIAPHQLVWAFSSVILNTGFVAIHITPSQAIRSGLLPLHHKDPFDRVLAAQSLELGIALISIDRIFDRYGVQRIW
jgi:PIN domain nuclease of toxin-antitoxin system